MSTFGFNERGVERIVAQVRRGEAGQPIDRLPPPRVLDKREAELVITAYTAADVSPRNRWKYTLSELIPTTAGGIDGWSQVADAADGLLNITGYNRAERLNVAYDGSTTSPTILGNGIDVGRTPAQDFEVAPIPIGAHVFAQVYLIDVDGEQRAIAWFTAENMLDGEC